MPFQALLDYLEGGDTIDEFLDDFPTVSRDAAIAALELAQSVLARLETTSAALAFCCRDRRVPEAFAAVLGSDLGWTWSSDLLA